MVKKGVSHVDWAISIGIFLVYVLGLFIFLKPGLEPVYRDEILDTVLDENFFEEINMLVERRPLYIDDADTGGEDIEVNINYRLPFDPFEYDDSNFALYDENMKSLPLDVDGNLEGMKFRASIQSGKRNTFLLVYSEEAKPNSNFEGIPIETITYPENGQDPTFEYSFGVTEKIIGISANKLEDFFNIHNGSYDDYINLKEEWDYPMDKEFAILVQGER